MTADDNIDEGVTRSDAIAPSGTITRGDALAEQAYVVLRDMILGHRLAPGTRLSVPDMARRLGVSRSPVREAIARITYEGLAQYEPHKGAVVAKLNPADLIEIYQLREVLEGLACRLAAERISDRAVDELGDVFRDHEAAVAADDVERHMELDALFHQLLRRSTGNARLNDALDRLQGQIRVAMYTTRRSPGGMKQAVAEHREIYQTIVDRDAEAAERSARAHVRRLRTSLHAGIAEPVTP